MISNKLSLLGIATKAGKAVHGTAACEKGLKSGSIKLLIMHSTISAGSEKRFITLCERYGSDYIKTDEPFGKAVGKEYIIITGITDPGFKKAILEG